MKVYRSLDRPSVLFGIRGSYFWILLVAAGVSILIGCLVGVAIGGLWGFLFSLLLVAASYGAVLYVQSRLSNRDLGRFLAGRRVDDVMVMFPVKSLLDNADTQKEE